MRPGFMLFELLVALTLILFILGFGGTHFMLLDQWLVKAELDKFYTTSMYMHYRAQLERADQVLPIDATKLARGVCFSGAFEAKGPPAYPEKKIVAPTSFTNKTIRFFADGSMQAGSLYFSNTARDCLYAFTIPVSAMPCMRIYEYNPARAVWEKIK